MLAATTSLLFAIDGDQTWSGYRILFGARGVGKTFWSSALRSPEVRELLGSSVPDLARVEVYPGFGFASNLADYPDGATFGDLLSKGGDAYQVWRAVVARWLAAVVSDSVPCHSWEATVDWVKGQPETFGRLLERAAAHCVAKARIGLIVFDALDRSSMNWQTMDSIVRDLLRVVLSLKSFPALHGKVFLREDQFIDLQIADFPDASKLLSTRVELTWAPHDLHGLLWHGLCNGPDRSGRLPRGIYQGVVGSAPTCVADEAWVIADTVKREGRFQRTLFEALAGKWMGRDRRRGIPYSWTVGHLADGRGRASPRSFLAAIRAAAEDTQERYPDHSVALHYESIKRGVQKASDIRVWELAEDYPWVNTLMSPLRGLTVPCAFEAIADRWVENLGEHPADMSSARLPPEHYEQGWTGIRADLETLGIFESMKDGRVNMPDLHRVGFGLGRRGGVKPVTKVARE